MENLSLKDRLHLVRLAKGMSKSKMAKMLHISPSYLTRLENGERPMPHHIIDMLNLEQSDTLRWYYNLMHILKPFTKHYLLQEEIEESKRVLKTILGI